MQKRVLPSAEISVASKSFEKFFAAQEVEDIIEHYKDFCAVLQITPGPLSQFYPVLKSNIRSNCAINLFQVLDKKISNDSYSSQYACHNLEVCIVGGGPCGLRTAVESQLQGAKVHVCEKRTSYTRNNVLHLWPFVIEDLKLLGVKQFFPKFCTGSMNHISIRRLQAVLVKVALVLGVSVSEGVEFVDLLEPGPENSSVGWRAKVNPPSHYLNKTNIDVLIGAEGKRVTVPGFKRKEFRGKLAIAITANFVNNRTTAEAVVEEISGIAFVYKQDFFNSLYEELGVALENIVYYKDETHYFVMTTKKHSLLDRKVLKKDLSDPIELLSPKNTNKTKLLEYIRDTCDYCTDYQLPDLDFAINHHGEPDVALFDFTSMFAASNSSYVKEKNGKQILLTLVGDGLLEPFWPTGSGAARGFLGSLDACYLMAEWCAGHRSVLELLAERESIYRLLAQTTSENIAKDYKNYTVKPTTRYPNLNKYLYSPHQMTGLYISDNEEKGMIPRIKYTPSCGDISSTIPKSISFQRPAQRPQQQRQRASSLDYDSESSGSPVIEHRDLKSRMRALMDAANGKSSDNSLNDADKYVNNRAKLREKQEETTKVAPNVPENKNRNINTQQLIQQVNRRVGGKDDEKVDRKAAMEKISQTFGYGEGPKIAPPPLVSAKERQAEKNKQEKSQPSKLSKQNTMPDIGRSSEKKKPNASSKAKPRDVKKSSPVKGVEKWDFSKMQSKNQSSPPINLDSSIDPELDMMLAELEMDDDFKKLNDNDQLTWLESLFYLDTPSKQSQSKLVKPKPKEELPNRRGKSALSLYTKDKDVSNDSSERANGVSAKTFSIQNRRERPGIKQEKDSPVFKQPKEEISSFTDDDAKSASANRESGVNKDLCSLAQSFFDSKPKKQPPQRRVSATNPVSNSKNTPSPSSALSIQGKNDRRSFPTTQERAFFQPDDSVEIEEEDDFELPTLSNEMLKENSRTSNSKINGSELHLKTPSQIYKERSPSSPEDAPPIPERSAQPKMMMLKLMKNATNALK